MGNRKIPVTITIDPEIWKKLTRISKNLDFSRSNLIEISLKTLFQDENLEDEGISLRQDKGKYT